MSAHRLTHASSITLVAGAAAPSGRYSFPGDGEYTEVVYAPVLGPTALLVYRRFVRLLRGSDRTLQLELDDLAQSFGVRREIAERSIERLVAFHLGELDGDVLTVQMSVPPLSARTLERLSPSVCGFHLVEMHRAARAG